MTPFLPFAERQCINMKSVLLTGLGNFGVLIARQLNDLGHEIMAVDISEEKVNEVLPYVTSAQIGDSTNEAFLKQLGVSNYDVCIVAIKDDFQASLETTSLLKELGGKYVIATAEREVQAKFLKRNGADEVVNPEKHAAEYIAVTYTTEKILDYMKLDASHAIFEVMVPKDWIGKTIGQLDIRKHYSVNVLAVKENGILDTDISADTFLTGYMTLLVLGESRAVKKCFKI